MASAIPALSGFAPSTILPVPLPPTAPPGTPESNIPTAEPTLTTPSTVVTLGTSPSAPLTYNAAGRVGSVPALAAVPAATEELSAVATEASAAATTQATPATDTATAVVNANASDTATAVADLAAQNSLADLINQAHNNIAGNPAYASAAAGLYASVAVFRAQLVPATLPPVIEALPPVTAVNAINAVNPV